MGQDELPNPSTIFNRDEAVPTTHELIRPTANEAEEAVAGPFGVPEWLRREAAARANLSCDGRALVE